MYRGKPFPFTSGLGHGGEEPVRYGHRGCHLLLHHRSYSVPLLLQGQVGEQMPHPSLIIIIIIMKSLSLFLLSGHQQAILNLLEKKMRM